VSGQQDGIVKLISALYGILFPHLNVIGKYYAERELIIHNTSIIEWKGFMISTQIMFDW
jgi:hypothetical protein